MKHPVIPVILSGGTGSRLWPISREAHPKPFLKLPNGESLLQKTFMRATHIPGAQEIITLTNHAYYLKSKAEYESIDVAHPTKQSFLLEPQAKNTAPAITFAVMHAIEQYGEEAVLLVLPADHLIEDVDAFLKKCSLAIQLAEHNQLITFGIKPERPETGYGYIECAAPIPSYENAFSVKCFVEKPSIDQAQRFIESQSHLWNSGMFCFKAKTFLEAMNVHAKELLSQTQVCWQISIKDQQTDFINLEQHSFANLTSISIDYALMEKITNLTVLACDFAWQDIGSWESYQNLHHTDGEGNTVLGDALLVDSYNNFIHSDHRMIASIGINNLHVIDTPDALLIASRERSQEVATIVNQLKQLSHESYYSHRTVIKPWGHFTILEEGNFYKIKRLVVKPHESLSLQSHQRRSEHWIVVEGDAMVINGDKEYRLSKNESTFVPMNTKHRLSNPSDHELILIEVQTGDYFGEDDIVRYADNYGREGISP